MIVFYSPGHKRHTPHFQYFNGMKPHPESPGRIDSLLVACKQQGLQIRAVTTQASIQSLRIVHSRAYLTYLSSVCKSLPANTEVLKYRYSKDTYTPLNHYTYDAASKAAQAALRAAKALLGGEQKAYALCRPPGHHAGRNSAAGFCYLNNAALAAAELAKRGKVAILDIDYHHGNGTQSIFYRRSDVLYVSLHANPQSDFPHDSGFRHEQGAGPGKTFTRNYPLPKNTTGERYIKTLRRAVAGIQSYAPDYVVVSFGFDIYRNDPIAGFALAENDYYSIGRLLAAAIPQPTLLIQEGGYAEAKLGLLLTYFFKGYLRQSKN